jgi:preprotein translocase subunit YajC
MNQLLVLLQAAQGGEAASGSNYQSLIMLALIMGIFYFFMIRPQQKKAKKQKQFRESLKKGDKIVTIGGIHGKIIQLDDATAVIETEDGSKLRIERGAISQEFTEQSFQEGAKG